MNFHVVEVLPHEIFHPVYNNAPAYHQVDPAACLDDCARRRTLLQNDSPVVRVVRVAELNFGIQFFSLHLEHRNGKVFSRNIGNHNLLASFHRHRKNDDAGGYCQGKNCNAAEQDDP
jgi:hypothetical protein